MFSSKQQEANPPSYNSSSSSDPTPGSSEYFYKEFLRKRKEEISEQLYSALIVELSPVGHDNVISKCSGSKKYLVFDDRKIFNVNESSKGPIPLIINGDLVFRAKDNFLFERNVPLIEDFTDYFTTELEKDVPINWMIEIRKTRVRRPQPQTPTQE